MFRQTIGMLVLALAVGAQLTGETVTIRSGNGSIGSTDASLHFLRGPSTGNFGHALTTADFNSAQSSPPAFILSPNPAWILGLSAEASARWIGTRASAATIQGDTALYAVSFRLENDFTAGTLTMHWAADDGIGESAGAGPNSGLYINGATICGNSFPIGFDKEHTVTCDISPTLRMGTNWLYIEGGNALGAAGLLFSAT